MKTGIERPCGHCPTPILPGQEMVPTPRGWTHQGCVSGGDDE